MVKMKPMPKFQSKDHLRKPQFRDHYNVLDQHAKNLVSHLFD